MDPYLPAAPEDRSLTPQMAPRPLRLVVIDGDADFAQQLERLVSATGRFIRRFVDGPSVEEVVAERPNAVVVDLRLLRWRAWDFLLALRDTLPDVGIVVCTGKSRLDQRLAGLRRGADDWLTKPCAAEEVLARAEASIRRIWRGNASRGLGVLLEEETIRIGDLELRPSQLQAFAGSRSADLTPHQFSFLHLLAERRGEVLKRAQIYELVWGHAMPKGDRAIDRFVTEVRRKLQRVSPAWSYIHTHPRVGYRFEPEPRATRAAEHHSA